ncbi:hypothetical protein [Kitasatospora sp. NPDC017646]|uniref:hypothetical protein n=1 Tax=Kitasatospora sp. NPDC017646 TaxID=3364024 RepID=UPI003790C865
MGEQQVGGPVQGGQGLARPGPALDDQRAGQGGADHPVLLGLDGGDGGAHPAGALAGERGEQGGLADQASAAGLVQPGEVERLVVQAGDGAALGVQVATAHHGARVGGGRGVERTGGGGAPVEQQRFVRLVGQAGAADVADGAVAFVEAAEAEAAFRRVEPGGVPGGLAGADLALQPGLVGAAGGRAVVGAVAGAVGELPGGVQVGVEPVEVGLFGAQGFGEGGVRRFRWSSVH